MYDPRLLTYLLFNYRALPGILRMYNDLFYNSKLIGTIDNVNSTEAKQLALINERGSVLNNEQTFISNGLSFCCVNGSNQKLQSSFSWCNEEEARKVVNYN